jgi:hypothetical protein
MDLAEVSARSRAVGEVAAKAVLTNDRAHIIAMVLTTGSMAQTGDVNDNGDNDIAPTKKRAARFALIVTFDGAFTCTHALCLTGQLQTGCGRVNSRGPL